MCPRRIRVRMEARLNRVNLAACAVTGDLHDVRQRMGGYSIACVAGIVHTGRMGRTVSALVTWGDAYLGVIGPFPVSTPWWSEVEPVVAHLREVLDVPVLVLRLLLVDDG